MLSDYFSFFFLFFCGGFVWTVLFSVESKRTSHCMWRINKAKCMLFTDDILFVSSLQSSDVCAFYLYGWLCRIYEYFPIRYVCTVRWREASHYASDNNNASRSYRECSREKENFFLKSTAVQVNRRAPRVHRTYMSLPHFTYKVYTEKKITISF